MVSRAETLVIHSRPIAKTGIHIHKVGCKYSFTVANANILARGEVKSKVYMVANRRIY